MILRLLESSSKITCKYISTPVLLKLPEIEGNGVKFDIRYVLLVRRIRSLKLYVHKVFWLRFANKSLSMKDFDEQMDCKTFIHMYNDQYSETWSILEERIFQIFRELFHCASIEEPPFGIGSCLSSRGLYTADLILERTSNNKIQPKLLEMNSRSDYSGAWTSYPNFYNQIFNVLFRDLIDNQNVIDISV